MTFNHVKTKMDIQNEIFDIYIVTKTVFVAAIVQAPRWKPLCNRRLWGVFNNFRMRVILPHFGCVTL